MKVQCPDTTTLLRRFDDLLTSLVVDKLALWFTTRKFQPKDPVISKVTKSSLDYELAALIFREVILNNNVRNAAAGILSLIDKYELIHKTSLSNPKVLTDHAQLYLNMYHTEAGYELGNTRQYDSLADSGAFGSSYGEACILATQEFRKGATLNFLLGKRSALTPEQLATLKEEGQDFSVIVSVRSLKSCLLLGPIRFVNHDCDPNTVFRFLERNIITLQTTRTIQFGEEITVSYGDNYFGVNNCECLCVTCERNRHKKPEVVAPSSAAVNHRYVTRHVVTATVHQKHNLSRLNPKCPANLPYFERKESSPECFAKETVRFQVPIRSTCSKFRAFFDVLFANPSLKIFRAGFNAWPPELNEDELNIFSHGDYFLDCEWCHNGSRQPVLPRTHIPIIFLSPGPIGFPEVDESNSFVHVAQFIHQLGRNAMLCMKCYRHYEIFALPWPYREYSEKIKLSLTRPYSPPPISVVVPKRKILDSDEFISDEEKPVKLFKFSLRRRRLHALRALQSLNSPSSNSSCESSPSTSVSNSPLLKASDSALDASLSLVLSLTLDSSLSRNTTIVPASVTYDSPVLNLQPESGTIPNSIPALDYFSVSTLNHSPAFNTTLEPTSNSTLAPTLNSPLAPASMSNITPALDFSPESITNPTLVPALDSFSISTSNASSSLDSPTLTLNPSSVLDSPPTLNACLAPGCESSLSSKLNPPSASALNPHVSTNVPPIYALDPTPVSESLIPSNPQLVSSSEATPVLTSLIPSNSNLVSSSEATSVSASLNSTIEPSSVLAPLISSHPTLISSSEPTSVSASLNSTVEPSSVLAPLISSHPTLISSSESTPVLSSLIPSKLPLVSNSEITPAAAPSISVSEFSLVPASSGPLDTHLISTLEPTSVSALLVPSNTYLMSSSEPTSISEPLMSSDKYLNSSLKPTSASSVPSNTCLVSDLEPTPASESLIPPNNHLASALEPASVSISWIQSNSVSSLTPIISNTPASLVSSITPALNLSEASTPESSYVSVSTLTSAIDSSPLTEAINSSPVISSDSALTSVLNSSKSSRESSPYLYSTYNEPTWASNQLVNISSLKCPPGSSESDSKSLNMKVHVLEERSPRGKSGLASSNKSFATLDKVDVNKPTRKTPVAINVEREFNNGVLSESSEIEFVLSESNLPLPQPSEELISLSALSCLKKPSPKAGSKEIRNKPLDIVLVSNTADFIFNSYVGLVIPDCDSENCCACVNTDPTHFLTIYRFDNRVTELAKQENIFTIDNGDSKLPKFLCRRPWFLSKPGMRAALAFFETDKTLNYPETENFFLSEMKISDLTNSCGWRKHISRMEYNTLLDRYSCHEGEKWLAVFPQEGYTQLAISIVGFMVFDDSPSVHTYRDKFFYYVKLRGTNTHRWIRPDQLLSHISQYDVL